VPVRPDQHQARGRQLQVGIRQVAEPPDGEPLDPRYRSLTVTLDVVVACPRMSAAVTAKLNGW
jgi:hypothetical protein